MPYSQFLFELNNFIWLGYLLVLLLTFLLRLGERSYYIGSTIVVIVTLTMQVIEPVLIGLSKEHPYFVWYAWHFIFASCDFIAAVMIYKIHRTESTPVGFVSMSIMVTFVIFCFVQAARYLDLVILKTNVFSESHRIVVNTLNLGLLVFLCHPTFIALKARIRRAIA